MCLDANRQAREAARQRKKEKDFAYAQEGLKFFNREATYEKTLDKNLSKRLEEIKNNINNGKYFSEEVTEKISNNILKDL